MSFLKMEKIQLGNTKMKSNWESMPALAVELDAFEMFLGDSFKSKGFIQEAARDMVLSDGKRLRPALTIACAMTGRYDRARTLPLAAAIEVIHTATLVHDDVIDDSDTRRGKITLHASHGNHIAIYVGDFLLARSLKLMSSSDLPIRELSRFADAVEQICTGDLAQYLGRSKVPGYRTYLKRIMGKTGVLFAAACLAGAGSGGLEEREQKQLWHFGMRLGAAFQIRDDLLDLDESQSTAGKPTGRDLIDGIITLPILLSAANTDYKRMLETFLQGERSEKEAMQLVDMARELGSVKQARSMLEAHLTRCHSILSGFPDSDGKNLLVQITNMLY